MTSDYVTHQGRIERIEKHKVFVRIEQKTACQDCHAGSVCLASDKKEKIIEVNDFSDDFVIQEEVIVMVRSSSGLMATFIAYTLPILLVITTIIVGIHATQNEVIGGLMGLLVLLPYYYILFLFRDKMKKRFVFSLSKLPNKPIINTKN